MVEVFFDDSSFTANAAALARAARVIRIFSKSGKALRAAKAMRVARSSTAAATMLFGAMLGREVKQKKEMQQMKWAALRKAMTPDEVQEHEEDISTVDVGHVES